MTRRLSVVALTVGLSMLVIPRALREYRGRPRVTKHGLRMPDGASRRAGGDRSTHLDSGFLPFLLGGVAASTVARITWPVIVVAVRASAAGVLALMMGGGFRPVCVHRLTR